MVKIAGLLVVGVWLVMAGTLIKGGPADTPAASRASLLSGEQWMGIYLNGSKVGYGSSRVVSNNDGYVLTGDMVMTFNVQGAITSIHSQETSELDAGLRLRRFDFSIKSGPADMAVKGVMSGHTLRLEVDSGGTKRTSEVELDELPMTTDMDLYFKLNGFEVGRKYRVPFFNTTNLVSEYMDVLVEAEEEVKLGGELIPVYRVSAEISGVHATFWTNQEVGTIKAEGIMGLTFIRETKEQAMRKPAGGYQPADIIAMNSIKASGAVPADPRSVTYMKAELAGADLSGLEIDGHGQRFKDGIIGLVEVENGDARVAGPSRLPLTGPGLDEYLEPTPFVQADDPAIKRKAAEINGGEKDALKAARKLSDWVFRSIKKQPATGVPSAAEVLVSLTGDCNEHTALYTALARSAGIPTRMAGGIVMMDGRFYYHAWPEVYVGEWVSIDPTFGQFPADATHIRLVEGGLDKQVVIGKVIGKLKVEVVESR
ncbi:MAG: transglutaminase domain-containing protein [Nitrospirae bacterium]|nr:transglutaminase domain-containing protein [Nitrospirota bacterium]